MTNSNIRLVSSLDKAKQMKRQSGFTLVELAVVVLLVGMFAAIGITALKAQLAGAASSATKKKQEMIKDALIAYLAKNRRLPCPAVDEKGGPDANARNTALYVPNCKTYFGLVPYSELGLPKSAAMDGWENFFTYAVSQPWTATLTTTCPVTTPGTQMTCTPADAFNVGNTGAIPISDRASSSSATTTPITSTAVLLLISHGVNGEGAYTTKGTQNATPAGADEGKNAIPQALFPLSKAVAPIPVEFFQREYTDKDDAPGRAFDDIVSWYSASDLLNPLIKDRAMQSAYGQYADQAGSIREWVVGYILSNSCKIPSFTDFPANLKNDPWGKAVSDSTGADFEYQKLTASSITTLPVASAVNATYTLKNKSANQTIDGPTIGWLRGAYQQCLPP